MPLKQRIYNILEPNDNAASRVFNAFIIILIIAATVSIIVSTIPGFRYQSFVENFEIAVIIIFTIEYLLRLWCSPNRIKTAFSFLGIIDFLSIFPFYLVLLFPHVMVDLRVLRILRVLRMFRVLKLARYIEALNVIAFVIREKIHQLVVFLFMIAVILLIVSSLIYYIEPENFNSIPEAFWWSIVTLTTVGYGDMVPKTPFGKLVAGVIMLIGVGIIAIPTGIISSGLTQYFMEKKGGRICPECKTTAETDANYCKICGRKF